MATPAPLPLAPHNPAVSNGAQESLGPAERFIPARGRVVAGRYVIGLPEVNLERGAEERAFELAAIYGGSVKSVLWATFEMEMSEEEARALSRDPGVRFVTPKPDSGYGATTGRFQRSRHPDPGIYGVTLTERPKFLTLAAIRQIADDLVAKHGGFVQTSFN
jgi:hypothetical protein